MRLIHDAVCNIPYIILIVLTMVIVIGPHEMPAYASLRTITMAVKMDSQGALLSRAAQMISALPASARLTSIDLRLLPSYSAPSERDHVVAYMLSALTAAHDHIEQLETVRVEMVQARSLKFLQVGLYLAGAYTVADPVTELLYYLPSSKDIRAAFPRLYALGALRL